MTLNRLLGFVVILITLTSCAANTASINSYADPSLQSSSLRSIAVFPIRNARMAPSEAQQLNRKVSQAINAQNPNIRILGSAESVTILNQNDLADDWAVFLENYITSGVPNASALGEIGSALGVDAIMQGEMVNIQQSDGTYGYNRGQTRVTVRYSLLGTAKGKLLWEASADGLRGTATTIESAPPIIEAINLAIDKILENLPAV